MKYKEQNQKIQALASEFGPIFSDLCEQFFEKVFERIDFATDEINRQEIQTTIAFGFLGTNIAFFIASFPKGQREEIVERFGEYILENLKMIDKVRKEEDV